jgi:hypothetical protein
VADAMGELFEPDRWVSVVGITGAGMRPLYDVEEAEILRLLGARSTTSRRPRARGTRSW